MAGKKSALILAAVSAAFLLCGADDLLDNARKGDSGSQLALANEFFFGKNRKANPSLAYYWFHRAADGGSAVGRYNMAVCLQKGWGCKKNQAGAFKNFEIAMKSGVTKAAVRYAEMLHAGVEADTFEDEKLPEIKSDRKKALEILRQVAPKDTEATELLAKMLYMDVEKNAPELYLVLKNYAENTAKPDPELLLIYSACLRSGIGGNAPDAAAGAEILRRNAKSKHPESMAQLAEMMFLGLGMTPDKSGALKLYQEASTLGSARAKTDIANLMLAGIDLQHDPAEAFKLFSEAAEKKYPPALCKLGDCYAFGIGTEPDIRKALFNYMKAAELGNRLAAFRLGEYYRDGKYLPKNPAASFHFFSIAAKAGYPAAMREAGKALLGKYGLAPDFRKAEELLRRAAGAGDKEAAELLREKGLYF